MNYWVTEMKPHHLDSVVDLQRQCYPAPFSEDFLWTKDHLAEHMRIFPQGQLVALHGSHVVGSASNLIIPEEHFMSHEPWYETVGGFTLSAHDPLGTTLYGADISVHPSFRRLGVARALYRGRIMLVLWSKVKRFATACRVPDFQAWLKGDPTEDDLAQYLELVSRGDLWDRTLSPLLRLGLTLRGGQMGYMEDEESLNCAARLEWTK